MLPTGGISDQLILVFDDPRTRVVNCCVWDAFNVDVNGDSETVTGVSTMLELADLLGSATLVAVRVMVCRLASAAGAV